MKSAACMLLQQAFYVVGNLDMWLDIMLISPECLFAHGLLVTFKGVVFLHGAKSYVGFQEEGAAQVAIYHPTVVWWYFWDSPSLHRCVNQLDLFM